MDPEVLQNVPGHVDPNPNASTNDFKTEGDQIPRWRDSRRTSSSSSRLKQGVYGQRQADVQMIRVKLPFGGVHPEQMEAFADVIEKYVPRRKGPITTRQNIQMHHVSARRRGEADPRARRLGAVQP